jgi:hypothetical protein
MLVRPVSWSARLSSWDGWRCNLATARSCIIELGDAIASCTVLGRRRICSSVSGSLWLLRISCVRPWLISMTMRVFVSGEYRCDAWQLLWSCLSLSDGWLHLHGSCGKGLGFQRDASSMATLPKRQNHQPCCHLLGRRACPGLQACCALLTRSIQMKISDSRRCTCTTFSQRQ